MYPTLAAERVPRADYEQLRSEVEQKLWQSEGSVHETKLSAPFVKLNERSRLMIDGPRKSAFSWPSIVRLDKSWARTSISVEVVNGSMGRPLLFDRKEGEVQSHYGDVSGSEYFNAFILDLDNDGGLTLSGHQFSKKEIKTLDSVNPQELIAFGRVILNAVNIHEAKLYDESRALTQS